MAESELFWNQLLSYVEEGNVVPVLGEGLLRLDAGGHPEVLYSKLARDLTGYLGLAAGDLPAEPTLNDVACRYLEGRNTRRDDVYAALKQVMSGNDELAVPAPLVKLAEIRRLRLFVTTSFDPFLGRALDQVHGDGATQILAYSPERPADLPQGWEPSRAPTVFHLFGRLSTEPSYAVTDEDTLEFLHALQSENRRPERLLDRLDKAHLLILGCRFDNWLARFFLRATVRERLCVAAGADYLADSWTLEDPQLVHFLRSFSARVKVFESGGALGLVDELHRRWLERHPDGGAVTPGETPDADFEVPPGAVFLSYASEDRDTAASLRDALDAVGVDVWFDKTHLGWGDRWEPKIRRCIERCAFFLPIVSAHTLTEERRYFRVEWDLAATEARKAKASAGYLLPVIIDDTPPDHPDIPEVFRGAQWERLRGGADAAALAARVRDLVREHRRRQRGST